LRAYLGYPCDFYYLDGLRPWERLFFLAWGHEKSYDNCLRRMTPWSRVSLLPYPSLNSPQLSFCIVCKTMGVCVLLLLLLWSFIGLFFPGYVDDLPSSGVTLLRVYGREESLLCGVFFPWLSYRYILEHVERIGGVFLV